MSYKRDTEITVLCYVNRAHVFVYILNADREITG